MNLRKPGVRIFDDRVEKRQSVARTQEELYGTEMGRYVAKQCGHFHVPQILAAEADDGLIVFERMSGSESLRRLLPVYSSPAELIMRTAKALAAIHSLGKSNPESRATEFSHGDFTIDNVFYISKTDRLYIIDWSIPVWQPDVRTAGRYQDLALFVMSLFARPVFYPKRIRRVSALASEFFDVYRAHAEFDPSRMRIVFDQVRSMFLRYHRQLVLWRFLANYPSTLRCRRFVSGLARQ